MEITNVESFKYIVQLCVKDSARGATTFEQVNLYQLSSQEYFAYFLLENAISKNNRQMYCLLYFISISYKHVL